MLPFLVLIIVPIALIYYNLRLTYLFQIKEYRFDRLLSWIKEVGFKEIIIPNRAYIPRISIRNMLIVAISLGISFVIISSNDLLFGGFLFFSLFTLQEQITILSLGLTLAYILALAGVLLGVIFTAPIAILSRKRQINMARKNLATSKAIFIGITGSFGKSSTKDFLQYILSQKFETEKTYKNYNSSVGVAISINQNIKPTTEYFVTEMGAYKRGEIKEVTELVKPRYGILTGIGNQHLDLFGSKDNLVTAKGELLKALPQDGTAYVNIDNPDVGKALIDLKCSVVTCSQANSTASAYAKKIEATPEGTKATIFYKNADFNIETKLVGKHNITNLVPCIALAYDLGVTKEQIEKCIKEISPRDKNLNIKAGLNGITFLDNSYNSNLEGVLSAIEVLSSLKQTNKVIVTKGIIELGSEKACTYNKILEKIYENNIVLLSSDALFQKLDNQNQQMKGLYSKANVNYMESENEFLEKIRSYDANSAVLIQGRFTDRFLKCLN